MKYTVQEAARWMAAIHDDAGGNAPSRVRVAGTETLVVESVGLPRKGFYRQGIILLGYNYKDKKGKQRTMVQRQARSPY